MKATTRQEEQGHGNPRNRADMSPCGAQRDATGCGQGSADRPVKAAERDGPRSGTNRELDELDLEPRGQPHRPREDREKRRPDRADERLWIGDRERCRREWRAEQRENRPVGLQRSEVDEHDRRARHECGEPRGQHPGQELPGHPEPRGMSSPWVIARHPREPARLDRKRQMPEREHAAEAQLKSRPERVRWRGNEHRDRGDREHRVTVPLPSKRAARRTDDRHQRRSHGARGGRHQHERAKRCDAARDRVHAFIRRDGARSESDDPSENGEVES